MVLNDDNRSLGADIMWNRPVVGSTGWTRYDIVIDVPPGATKLSFGASLKGRGSGWVDDLKLETVDLSVPLTTEPAFPREPVNLGFEDVTPPAVR